MKVTRPNASKLPDCGITLPDDDADFEVVMFDPAFVVPDPAFGVPDPAFVVPDPAFVVPDPAPDPQFVSVVGHSSVVCVAPLSLIVTVESLRSLDSSRPTTAGVSI